MKERIKIQLKPKPEVTDEEIRNAMDFESVLKKSRVVPSGFKFNFSKPNLNSILIASGAIVAVSIYFILRKDGENELVQQNASQANIDTVSSSPKTNIDIKSPIVARAINASNKIKNSPPSENSPQLIKEEKSNLNESKKTFEGDSLKENVSDVKSIDNEIKKENVEKGPVIIAAEPIGGYPKFYEYFNKERKYPKDALDKGIEGEVIAKCLIGVNGIPSQIEISKSLTAECDEEVIRIIKNMGPWKPATINGIPVVYLVELPVMFSIYKEK